MTQLTALEFYSGIGGFAATGLFNIVGAIDQSVDALTSYQYNFPTHRPLNRNLEGISATEIAQFKAQVWWLSPPCQPYTRRGQQKDLDDPRAKSFIHLLKLLTELSPEIRPLFIALENVEGFYTSRARSLLLQTLLTCGYVHTCERILCPTELGVPSRRPRYYLVAGKSPLLTPPQQKCAVLPLSHFIQTPDADTVSKLVVPDLQIQRFGKGLRILSSLNLTNSTEEYTTCFTSGYGRSLQHSGSYLRMSENIVRRFCPKEILNLLGFPKSYEMPSQLPLHRQWQLVGNSLSVTAIREILSVIPKMNTEQE